MFIPRTNFDHAYVMQREKDNDTSWNFIEKNLYYSVNNQNCIIPVIVGSLFCILCGMPFFIIVIALMAIIYCDSNNASLDNNTFIIKKRKDAMERYYKNKFNKN